DRDRPARSREHDIALEWVQTGRPARGRKTRPPLDLGRLAARFGDGGVVRRWGADCPWRRPLAQMFLVLRGLRKDRADHQYELVFDVPDGFGARNGAGWGWVSWSQGDARLW